MTTETEREVGIQSPPRTSPVTPTDKELVSSSGYSSTRKTVNHQPSLNAIQPGEDDTGARPGLYGSGASERLEFSGNSVLNRNTSERNSSVTNLGHRPVLLGIPNMTSDSPWCKHPAGSQTFDAQTHDVDWAWANTPQSGALSISHHQEGLSGTDTSGTMSDSQHPRSGMLVATKTPCVSTEAQSGDLNTIVIESTPSGTQRKFLNITVPLSAWDDPKLNLALSSPSVSTEQSNTIAQLMLQTSNATGTSTINPESQAKPPCNVDTNTARTNTGDLNVNATSDGPVSMARPNPGKTITATENSGILHQSSQP